MRNELTVTCTYPEDGRSVREILLESFQLFLCRELGSVAKGWAMECHPYDEWPLISGGMTCT